MGITGNVVMEKEKIKNISYISGLNFRVAKQIKGCSKSVWQEVLDLKHATVYNTLIVSAPGAGKTTLLRDLLRCISDGIPEITFRGLPVGIVDERGEIAAMYQGEPQNDVGIRTDVLDGVPKAMGLQMLVRSMAPKIVSTDEIGSKEDTEAIHYAVCSGVKGIFTAHGSCMEDLLLNPNLKELIQSFVFDKILFLKENGEKGKIKFGYRLEKQKEKYLRI